jgi:hypothetical protein
MPFLILLALLIAPFGRVEQAQAAVQHGPATAAMAGHCDPPPAKAPAPAHHGSIDCMIACAGMLAVEASLMMQELPAVAATVAAPIAALDGILPQFDPPPPRSLS